MYGIDERRLVGKDRTDLVDGLAIVGIDVRLSFQSPGLNYKT